MIVNNTMHCFPLTSQFGLLQHTEVRSCDITQWEKVQPQN